jgi:poly(beta-D-mannuronate) lyase
VATGGARQRTSAAAVSNRNNHVLLRATIEAQVALQAARPDLARRAYERARATLAGMRPDGSLPLETARGRRALWYQRHALASLVYIGDLLAPFGLDIWQPRADGADLHHAVAFLVQAIDRPELLAPYVGADDIRQQDLGFLGPRNNGRHYMAWALLYRARFPARDEAAALARWLPVAGQPGWPLVDDYVGGNATCRVFTATP